MDIKQAFGSCPRCGTGVDYREEITVCNNCGWMPERKENIAKFGTSVLILGIVCTLAFMHIINWGVYSFDIIPLRTKAIVGMASLEDLQRAFEICEEQLKYDCAAVALNEIAWETEHAKDFKLLGDLHRRMSQWEEAIEAYEFSLAKMTDKKIAKELKGDTYYGLAKSFHEVGELALAENYYKKSLRSKPGILQVTVTTDYARMLKQAGKAKQSKLVDL